MIYNPVDGGALGIWMRNKRHVEKKSMNEENGDSESMSVECDGDVEQVLSEEEAEELVSNLKFLVVNDDNIDTIKKGLLKTLQYRSKLLTEMKLNLREYFPYFFTNPNLVIFEYPFRTAKVYGERVDENGFLSKWPNVSARVFDVLNSYHKIVYISVWCQEISEILCLLKMLPAKTTGRNLLTISAFEGAVSKLFVFRQVCNSIEHYLKNNCFKFY